ncbi:hypothetical protein EXIGLDRAFT_723987 [Exidia glandulosa HHB12029]|uniref:Uncharacterized protein n=1 Tax=Exidia glandulosa HHB12029 TaxID=1314781 RepID=A0A165ZZT4_EXIGL|nr:hypothetical protein EXIGLDRAFT_723987 [Exidia glandulosa HHB12029]
MTSSLPALPILGYLQLAFTSQKDYDYATTSALPCTTAMPELLAVILQASSEHLHLPASLVKKVGLSFGQKPSIELFFINITVTGSDGQPIL